MDEDQDFEAFLREWAKERIWPTHDVLLQDLMAEARALELIRLAMVRGFRDEPHGDPEEVRQRASLREASHERSSSVAEKHQHLKTKNKARDVTEHTDHERVRSELLQWR
jgi:hypothetical protein